MPQVRRRSALIKIDGSHVLYHYLQKDLLENDLWLFQMLAARLIVALGIWFHPETYRRCPVMVPFAAREAAFRGDAKKGREERWGSPTPDRGLFGDDNSLVKGLPAGLPIEASGNGIYGGRTLGPGFVASHVWRITCEGASAAREPGSYSFVPNLVWLPSQVSKLTDREGSFAQTFLQAMARKIYSTEPVPENLSEVVRSIWDSLPEPSIPERGLPELHELNFFRPTQRFFDTRTARIREVIEGLEATDRGERPEWSRWRRYAAGLAEIDPAVRRDLRKWLEPFAQTDRSVLP
jgi:hypothetical protein